MDQGLEAENKKEEEDTGNEFDKQEDQHYNQTPGHGELMPSNDDASRPHVESACGRLEDSRSSSRYRKPPNSASSSHHVSFVRSKSKTSYELPLIYFVVRKDRIPKMAENFPNGQRTSLKAYASKSRQQFLTSRKEKKLRREEELKQVRELGSAVGLKVEPVKTLSVRSRGWLPTQTTTPFHTISERSELKSQEFFNHDGLSADAKPHGTFLDVEIPHVTTPVSRTGTPESGNSSKKVHFAKRSARSKSCSIQLPKVDQSAEDFFENEVMKTVKNTNLPRTTKVPKQPRQANTPRTKRDANVLSLPKIDMITPIYDELILKTFQTFMTTKNPIADKTTRAILQRVSAFLHPINDSLLQETKTPVSRPPTRATSFFSTEPPEESEDLDLTEVSSSITIDGKSMSMLMRDVDSKQRRPQVQSTCFQMAPPGLGREETFQASMSSKKHTIYIPSTC